MNSIRSRWDEWTQSKLVRLFLICMVSGILVVVLSGAAVAKYAVIILDENTKTIVYTSEPEPKEILRQQNIALATDDALSVSNLKNNERIIEIHRASLVRVLVDGTEKSVYIAQGTAQDALTKLGILVDDNDLINVAPSEPVNGEMNIVINRVEVQTVEKSTVIPFEVHEIPTQTLDDGDVHVLTKGVNGKRTTTVQQTLVDGKVTVEKVLDEEITTPATAKRVLVGDSHAATSQMIPDEEIELDANGNPVNYVKKVTGKATAYSALGKPTKLIPGAVAMDLSKYPRGSRLYIKTPDGSFIYGYSEVRDTGPAVNEGIILVDLFFGSYRESCLFGAKTVDIYVLP